nr:hypothetical protein [Tanacetum cinerariifolium]
MTVLLLFSMVTPRSNDGVVVSCGNTKEVTVEAAVVVVVYGVVAKDSGFARMTPPIQNINYSAFKSMFERRKISGNNFNDWFRQLKLVFRVEKKMFVIEQPLPAALSVDFEAQILMQWNVVYDAYNEVACLILGSMNPELRRQFENSSPYDMIRELNPCLRNKLEWSERPAKDDACYHCKEVGHWKRNYPDLAELIMKKKHVDIASSSGVRKLKQAALYLYIGNGVRAQVEAIGSYDLVLLSKNDILYFNAIFSNGIYEIDMINHVPNVNSIYSVSNKRAKHNLDSTYLWHYRLAHISKKHIEKLQHGGILKSMDEESFDKCVSCLSAKMIRKPFPCRTKRVTDLLNIIHKDDYALETATRIFNMVPTKKVDKTPYEFWYGKVPNLSYLNVWGCEALVKRDTPDKLQQKSINGIIRRTMTKLIPNKAQTVQYPAEPSIKCNKKYELGEELLMELRCNSYSERGEEDVIDHIAKVLEVLDPIEMDGLDPFQLHMITFPLSLSGKCKKMADERWRWKNQHLGRVDDEEGLDPLEFITWRNSKFKDHKKVDETTKHALLYSLIEMGNNKGLIDDDISSDDDGDQTNLSMLTKPKIKIGDEFLKILHDNSFNDAKKWWDNEGEATTWKELCDKSFHKYYPMSHACRSNIPDDLGHGTYYFEFLYWLESKFDNQWELDKNVKNGLWEFYVNGRTKGTIDDLVNESCNKSNKNTCLDSFFKPHLDAQDGKDIYEIIDRDYSPIPVPAHRDISNPDELCQTEEVAVVRNHTAYPEVKENQEKDKIGSKPDKNGKRVEAGKSLKQLQ